MDGKDDPLRQKLRARGFVNVDRHPYESGHVYLLLDDRGGRCAELTFSHSHRGRWHVHINTLKFQEVERACRHSGWRLVQWIVGLAEGGGLADRITLEDEARMILTHRNRLPVHIDLTRFRKFTEGMGWYEKFGFVPTERVARLLYQASYDRVRRASADDVSFLIWTILRACLVRDAHAGRVLVRGIVLQDRLHWSGKALEDDHVRHHGAFVAAALRPLLSPATEADSSPIMDRCERVIEEVMNRDQVCDALVELLMRLGLSRSSRTRILGDDHERRWLQSHVKTTPERSACRCLVRALYPSNARKVQRILESDEAATDEVVEYLEMLHHFLEIMEMLGLLFTPKHLEYLPGSLLPPSLPECTRRGRVCSSAPNERDFAHLVRGHSSRYSRPYRLPTLEDIDAGRLQRTMVLPSRIPV